MFKGLIIRAAAIVSLGVIGPVSASAQDMYIGIDAIGTVTDFDMDGRNTNGNFFNTDSQSESQHGIALNFGLRDKWALGTTKLTPEAEFAWYFDRSVTSASFPGLPAPTFFYNSSVESGRLGLNLWALFHETNHWRAEAGLGLGAMYRDISTSDGVVMGSGDDYVLYGKFGLRFIRAIDDRNNLVLGVNYVVADKSDIMLRNVGGGAPAGNFSMETSSVELHIGYRRDLN
ncbi:hypothetical protein [Roseovarius amoyensis]|uniref:hypothetical protein n=1 Tax=Roseovarius amoyensis TaxID=2211448 RepID=UPI000DBE0B5B|nr:hypothetical protein [Roseovarius amoyensis]